MKLSVQFALLCALMLAACGGTVTTSGNSSATDQESAARDQDVVARLNGQDISLERVDRPIQLGLYDLEWEKYQLRRESLKRLVKQSGGQAEIFLEPPKPPRLEINPGDRPIRGDKDAPVLLSVFCSFQSSHCARLQPVLTQLRKDNDSLLALAYYDFPQGYHRYGVSAANAVRCAFEGKPNWEFLDSMFGIYDDMNFDRYALLVQQTGVSSTEFKACYDEGRYDNDVLDDVNYSQSLGFGRVPIVLVNGLYVKGPKTVEAYQIHIDSELDRLGVEKTSMEAEDKSDEEPELETEDLTPQGLGYDRVRDPANLPLRDKSQVTLSRNWVNAQLAEEGSLTNYFYKGDHAPEGNHVLKLSDVSGNAFFETMGFRKGDVILQVNGDWVHENQNGLWNELRYADAVEVKLIRRGKPVTYYYRFKD